MLIIGFGNKARQGKDTAAEAVRDFYDKKNEVIRKFTEVDRAARKRGFNVRMPGVVEVNIIKFADALYQETNEYLEVGHNLGITPAELFKKGVREVSGGEIVVTPVPEWAIPEPNPTFPKNAPLGKHPKLLQWWGTEYRRAQDPDYWVKKTFANIPKNVDIVLITDVRFPNEADAVKQWGGYTINVQRLRDDGQPFYASDRPTDHISETALDGYNWDYYIKSKNPVVTAELAITYAEYLRGLQSEQAKKA